MKTILCTVLLLVGLLSVSIAQQQIMQIRVWSSNAPIAKPAVFINSATTEEIIELEKGSAEKNANGKQIVAVLQRYLSKGWIITTHTTTMVTTVGVLDTYTLVKD
jgi:hypothetical protein